MTMPAFYRADLLRVAVQRFASINSQLSDADIAYVIDHFETLADQLEDCAD